MDDRFENAKRYYYVIIREVMLASDDQYYPVANVEQWILQKYPNVLAGSTKLSKNGMVVTLCLRDFIDKGWIDSVADEFAPLFVKRSQRLQSAPNADKEFKAISEKYESFGPAAETWLGSALASILDRFDQNELIERLTELVGDTEDKNVFPISSRESDAGSTDVDAWEPLKIDRATPTYLDAIEAADAAVREIEASNGYAASEPDERNGIVSTLKGTLEAVKRGFPSKKAILHGLVKPMEYVARKFPDATIGEIAKIAVAKLLAWLSTIL
jgi:hypothetical protein